MKTEKETKRNRGKLRTEIKKAFDKLKDGNLKGFVDGLVNVTDYGVRYAWQRNIVDDEIEIQLKELCLEKKYCKNIIQQHKKNMILESLK